MLFVYHLGGHNYFKYDNFVRINLAMGQIIYIGNNPMNKSGGGVSQQDLRLINLK